MNDLGDLIKNARKELKITTSQLGSILGISQGYVSHIENGIKTPSPEIIRRISKVLNLDLNTLMILGGYLDGTKDKLPTSLRVHFDETLNKHVTALRTSQQLTTFEDFLKWVNVCLDKTYYADYNTSDLKKIFEDKTYLSSFIFKGLNHNETLEEIEKEFFGVDDTYDEDTYNVHLESSFKLAPLKLEEVIEKAQTLSFNDKTLNKEDRAMILKVLTAIFVK